MTDASVCHEEKDREQTRYQIRAGRCRRFERLLLEGINSSAVFDSSG